MRPGRLNRRLSIQSRTFTRDAMGGRSESWSEDFKAWAELVTHKDAEKLMSEGDRSNDERHFRIRWRSDIDPRTHRVSYQGQVFNIKGMIEEGLQTSLILTCVAIESLTSP